MIDSIRPVYASAGEGTPSAREYRSGERTFVVLEGGGEDAASRQIILDGVLRQIRELQRLADTETNGLTPYIDPTIGGDLYPEHPDDIA